MPTVRDRHVHLSERQRRERVADLLARGVVRHLRDRRPEPSIREVAHKSNPLKSGLDLSARTRLHVSRG